MDILALVACVAAIIVFLFDLKSRQVTSLAIGLSLVSFALICQFVALTGHNVHN